MRITYLILCILLSTFGFAQEDSKFNLNFEKHQDEEGLSDGWFKWGNYLLQCTEDAYTGKKSGKIVSDEGGSSFGSIAYRIPANYDGKSIKLEGYMKIENVEDGFSGLLLRVDGDGRSLAFDNMESKAITGTRDWKKYSIELSYPEAAEIIFVAGILVGKGTAWYDEFKVTIDGKDLQTLKEKEKPTYKADEDSAFDNGSGVTIMDLSAEKITDLDLLGRVWGFLKYHHPAIAQGNYNWDYELFRILPEYLAVKNTTDRDAMLVQWIDGLGSVVKCVDCPALDENAFALPDHEWMEAQSKILHDKLLQVYEGRNNGKNYYINMASGVGNPEFKNESAYMDMTYPDDGFRLLTVFKYWNMIHYFFPYKHLMDKDWNLVLKEYIPKFLAAENELEYEIAALQLIGDIQDTHANLWGGGDHIKKWKGKNYAPAHVRFIEDQLVVTDFYNPELQSESNLNIGDVITQINGKAVHDIVEEKSKYYPASNRPTMLRNLSADLLRSDEAALEITYMDENGKKTTSLPLHNKDSLDIYRWYPRDDRQSYKMLDDSIGYITLQTIKDKDIAEIKEQFKETKGIIIDIRNYPSTFVPFKLGSFFISAPTPFAKFTQGSIVNPGEFTFRDGTPIPPDAENYNGKLIVLVNEFSQSQAEYTSMAFRAASNCTIIGSTTAGADGNISRISLPGQLKTMISGIGVYYPDGEETQRVGIVPDVEVKPTIKGFKNGKDEVLDKAIELILKESK